jgi:SAM-dependent methyltransferase/glycosyltransferase involved in cell wall biosynthesis
MKVAPQVSVIVPSRNEIFLQKTVEDILIKAEGDIEVIVVLDGYWPTPTLKDDDRLKIIHRGTPLGMRAAINSAVALASGKYLMKCDAHCMFAKGFDICLAADCDETWVVIPRRYALDAEKWEIIDNPKYPIDYMYLSKELHGETWNEKNKDANLKEKLIDETMSAQGSCWFMQKDYFRKLEIEDEANYGTFSNEFQEIGLKCWLSGGRVITNKKTWYAHLHKTKGRGYSLEGNQIEKGAAYTKRWLTNTAWHKQTLPFTWLIEKFWPVPNWPEDRTEWTPQNEQGLDLKIWEAGKKNELDYWREWLKRKGASYQNLRRLSSTFDFMIGDKKEVKIANLGAGAMCLIGDSRRDVKVKVISSDLLADEFEKIKKQLNITSPNPIEKQDMTNLTYENNTFDIVFCANALDHCQNPYKALEEMVRVCKPGGWIYLIHHAHEGKRLAYSGLHQWNIDITQEGDCIFWNKTWLPTETFLLSDVYPGFTSQVEPMRKMTLITSFVQKITS